MTFADAIATIREGYAGQDAAKRPDWAGYVYRKDTSEAGETPRTYDIVFRKRAFDDNSTPKDSTDDTNPDIAMSWDGSAWTAGGLAVDSQLWESLIAGDWTVGSAADFEGARSGGSKVW